MQNQLAILPINKSNFEEIRSRKMVYLRSKIQQNEQLYFSFDSLSGLILKLESQFEQLPYFN